MEQTMIEIKNLSKVFFTKHGEVAALKDINLTINKGNIYGIIGMSGAGKSTLVRCVNFLEKPTEGSVFINGEDLSLLSNKALREKRHSIGMIFQQFNLLMQKNVLKNITFPLEIMGWEKAKAKERAFELLKIVELEDKAKAYPSQLSGGQKQRVAIARALASSPQVLLCDEATSALDPKTTKSILKLLKDINKRLGITIVIITHEMSVIEDICTHVAIIDNSQICESGTVSKIFTNPKTAAAKKLVSPKDEKVYDVEGKKALRISFDGSSTYEPVIANMILDLGIAVNILYADMKEIDSKAYGQMIISLPEDDEISAKIIKYFKDKKLLVEEVDNND